MSQQSNHLAVTSTDAPGNAGEYLASFKRVEAEIRAIEEDDLEFVNIDVTAAVDTVRSNMDRMVALRDAMAKLGDFDIALLDKLNDYAQAVGYTQNLYRIAVGPKDPVTKLGAEVTAIRDLLFSDATALAKRGVFEEKTVEALRSPSGYRNIAYDTTSLVELFRQHKDKLAGKTFVSPEELDRAVLAAEDLLDALGDRNHSPEETAAAVLVRQQAYTLFVRSYDQVRRAVGFLRWGKGDADTIAPSLWAGRGKRPATETETPEPTTPPANPAPGATAPSTGAPVGAPVATNPANNIPVGFPGSNPFSS